MCVGSGFSSARFNPVGRLLGSNFKYADPLVSSLEKQEAKWFAAPPLPEAPPALQAQQEADTSALRSRRRKPQVSETLLTSPAGVSVSTGSSSLLGN